MFTQMNMHPKHDKKFITNFLKGQRKKERREILPYKFSEYSMSNVNSTSLKIVVRSDNSYCMKDFWLQNTDDSFSFVQPALHDYNNFWFYHWNCFKERKIRISLMSGVCSGDTISHCYWRLFHWPVKCNISRTVGDLSITV